jgi:hypothetical protein
LHPYTCGTIKIFFVIMIFKIRVCHTYILLVVLLDHV